MVSPRLTRCYGRSRVTTLGSILINPALSRPETGGVVVGGAADMTGLAY